MAVTDPDVIDLIGIDRNSGAVVLTIADHLDWSAPLLHLGALQEKLNAYLRFIDSGELSQSYPEAAGRRIEIEVALQHPLDPLGVQFFAEVGPMVREAGIGLKHRTLDADDPSGPPPLLH
jgi:hypothetical protein